MCPVSRCIPARADRIPLLFRGLRERLVDARLIVLGSKKIPRRRRQVPGRRDRLIPETDNAGRTVHPPKIRMRVIDAGVNNRHKNTGTRQEGSLLQLCDAGCTLSVVHREKQKLRLFHVLNFIQRRHRLHKMFRQH